MRELEEAKAMKKAEAQAQYEKQIRKPLLEQWLDDYWYAHVPPTSSTGKIDEVVSKMLNMLLIMGDTQM